MKRGGDGRVEDEKEAREVVVVVVENFLFLFEQTDVIKISSLIVL